MRIGNDERFLPAIAAAWLLEAAAVPMHPGAAVPEVARVVEALGIDAAVLGAADAARASIARPACILDPIAVRGADGPVHLDVPDIAGTDTALVLLTSGSTGRPKGVALPHDNAWSNLRQTVSAFRRATSPGDVQARARRSSMRSFRSWTRSDTATEASLRRRHLPSTSSSPEPARVPWGRVGPSSRASPRDRLRSRWARSDYTIETARPIIDGMST